jgi:hypothetical protein
MFRILEETETLEWTLKTLSDNMQRNLKLNFLVTKYYTGNKNSRLIPTEILTVVFKNK